MRARLAGCLAVVLAAEAPAARATEWVPWIAPLAEGYALGVAGATEAQRYCPDMAVNVAQLAKLAEAADLTAEDRPWISARVIGLRADLDGGRAQNGLADWCASLWALYGPGGSLKFLQRSDVPSNGDGDPLASLPKREIDEPECRAKRRTMETSGVLKPDHVSPMGTTIWYESTPSLTDVTMSGCAYGGRTSISMKVPTPQPTDVAIAEAAHIGATLTGEAPDRLAEAVRRCVRVAGRDPDGDGTTQTKLAEIDCAIPVDRSDMLINIAPAPPD